MNHSHRCPVCWRDIPRAEHENVSLHWDSLRKSICPMSGRPYDLMETDDTGLQGAI